MGQAYVYDRSYAGVASWTVEGCRPDEVGGLGFRDGFWPTM